MSQEQIEITPTLRVTALGDNLGEAYNYRQLHPEMHVYTQFTEGNRKYAHYGIFRSNALRYFSSEHYLGGEFDLPNDEPYPFSEFEESDATTIAEIARVALSMRITEILQQCDISDEYAAELLDKLNRAMDGAPPCCECGDTHSCADCPQFSVKR